MKRMKRFVSLLLTVVMVFAMSMTAFAEGTSHTITITNTNKSISINGRTYKAYKLFDSTHVEDAYAYTMSTSSQFYNNKLVTGQDVATNSLEELLRTYFTFTAVSGDSTKVNVVPQDGFDNNKAREFADKIQKFLTDKTETATAVAENETATINLASGEAGVGYYIVTGDAVPTDPNSTETVVSAVIITNEDPNAAIQPKAGIPTLDKKITGVKEGNTPVNGAVLDEVGQAAVAKVGSTVSYKIDSIVPDLTGYSDYTFEIGDAISDGLDYVEESFVLQIKKGEIFETVEIDPAFSTEPGKENRSFTLTIPYNTLKNYATGSKIVLTYNATVNADSLKYDYVNNTAKLTYSNSPYTDDKNETPDKKTYVININLDVDKVAGSENDDEVGNTKLKGAEFILYRQDDGETKEYYKWDTSSKIVTWTTEINAADTFITGENGNLTQQIRGLDKGTYYLVETKAPAGYNLLEDPVAITISVSKYKDPETGKEEDKVVYTATGAEVTNGTVDLTVSQNENQPVATQTIINKTGPQLPATGGMGTKLFYVLGTILVLGAGVLLITKRRMSK